MNCENALNAFPCFTAAESAKVRSRVDALFLLLMACAHHDKFVLHFFFSSPAFQVKHWKQHKKECHSLREAQKEASQPETHGLGFDIPLFILSLSPSLTNYPKKVFLLLPLWDLHDEKLRRELADSSAAKKQSFFGAAVACLPSLLRMICINL